MWELDCEEGWAPKNWCFWTVVLEKTLESPLDCKEIQPVHSKGDHSWVFVGRTDVEAETPILWPPDVKHWLIWKDPDAGKDWGQEEKGMTEDCREQGIKKVEKCLQMRLSTWAEHSCKRDVQLRILFVPMGKEHFLHTRMFLWFLKRNRPWDKTDSKLIRKFPKTKS